MTKKCTCAKARAAYIKAGVAYYKAGDACPKHGKKGVA